MDEAFIRAGREHIEGHRDLAFGRHVEVGGRLLEIGPVFPVRSIGTMLFETVDLLPGGTYEADITLRVPVEDSRYSTVICLDVLEHVVDPFAAVAEIRRVLAPGGLLYASAPFNVREHGPLPDCWRFTRNGWRVLLRDWDDLSLDVLMTPDRPLCPLHVNAIARCNKEKSVDARSIVFRREST